MQDLKHLSQKKPPHGLNLFGRNKNKLRDQERSVPRLKLSFPTGKRLRQLKQLLVFVAIVLVVAPLAFGALHYSAPALAYLGTWAETVQSLIVRPAEAKKKTAPPNQFETASNLLATVDLNSPVLSAKDSAGLKHVYTIQSGLQKRVYNFLAQYQVPYGVFVAIEPSSGRILGMTSYSSIDPDWTRRSAFELYPMASLFKIITASAALENGKINPASVIEFRGNSYSENPRYWDIGPKGKNNSMDVTYAMGKSINPLYGRVASDYAGKPSVMASISRYGFNQELFPGIPAKPSQAAEPNSVDDLRRMGAGLDHDVKISPLHAAVIMSAIANGGKMMAPGLTSSIVDENGVEKEIFVPRELRRLVTPETSAALSQMLSSTVLTGTSRRAFHDRQGRPLLDITIAAKTGSINGTDPRGHYSWFAAFAPIQNPRIALVALVINPDKWRIKASQVGEQALEEFFKK